MNAYLDKTDAFMATLGLDTYRVGGSVRDEILGRRVKDADYMVRDDLNLIFRRLMARKHSVKDFAVRPLTLRDGRQAGWRVSGRGIGCIEIVLPRKEVSTGPGHRDFEIVMDKNLTLEEDAIRRDFTFNALYKRIGEPSYEDFLHGTISDPTGRGLEDLQRRQINVTHADSFRDDPLRTMRALRFVSTLGYELGRETRAMMMLHADAVTGLSANGYASGTVLEELGKLLMGSNPAGALRLARDTGVLAVLLPELAPMMGFDQGSRYHDLTTDEHTFKALETAAHVDAPLRVRMALLFHDSGKPETAWVGDDGRKHYYARKDEGEDHEIAGARIWRRTARRLNAGNGLRDDVDRLIRNHMVPCQKFKAAKVARERVRLGDDLLRDLYLHRMCDLSGKGKANMQQMAVMAQMEAHRAKLEAEGVPSVPADLAVNGHDMAHLGIRGREIGRTLTALLDEVAVDPSELKRSREWQLERAKAL
jgi:tRNA nucleotidyltransferase/poly(A) polymerase